MTSQAMGSPDQNALPSVGPDQSRAAPHVKQGTLTIYGDVWEAKSRDRVLIDSMIQYSSVKERMSYLKSMSSDAMD